MLTLRVNQLASADAREQVREAVNVAVDRVTRTREWVKKVVLIFVRPTDEQLAALNAISGIRGLIGGIAVVGGAFAVGHPLIGLLLAANWLYEGYMDLVLNAGGWHAKAHGQKRFSAAWMYANTRDGVLKMKEKWADRRVARDWAKLA